MPVPIVLAFKAAQALPSPLELFMAPFSSFHKSEVNSSLLLICIRWSHRTPAALGVYFHQKLLPILLLQT